MITSIPYNAATAARDTLEGSQSESLIPLFGAVAICADSR
jgi:hypothetical protein